MDKGTQNWGAFVLELVGSLILLYVAAGLLSGGMAASAVWSNGGGIWLPFFVGVSVVASLALFFLSFANVAGGCDCGCGCCGCCGCGSGKKTAKVALAAGVTLIALTAGSMVLMEMVVVGFALAYVGTMSASMSCTCDTGKPAAKSKR